MSGRKGNCLFKKKGSANYHIRLQYPPETGMKPVKESLGTPDPREAEVLAAPMIAEHKKFLYLYGLGKRLALDAKARGERPSEEEFLKLAWQKIGLAHPENPIQHEQAPMTVREHADGTRSFATADEVHHIGQSGKVESTRPNEMEVRISFDLLKKHEQRDLKEKFAKAKVPVVRSGDPDWQIIKDYIDHQGKDRYWEAEAQETYTLFRKVTGKTFANADRADAQRLAIYLLDEYQSPKKRHRKGVSSATVTKKLNFLSAPINEHMRGRNPRIKFNPFGGRGIVPKRDDKIRRKPLYNADLEKIDANFHRLGPNEKLLYLVLRHTGCRRSEAWQIEETTEKGLRVMWFGEKTLQSVRRIPIPRALLPHLPEKIDRPLFSDGPVNVGKNLGRAMRRFGVTDPTKVVHSFRHRAKDRLRAETCPKDIQEAILGHQEITVAMGYGHGYPMTVLAPYVELIGAYDEPNFVPNPAAYAGDDDEE